MKIVDKLDSWCNETINNSFFINSQGNLFLNVGACHSKLLQKIIWFALYISVCVLFISLSLPCFASDRSGIGLIIVIAFVLLLLNILLKKPSLAKANSTDFLMIALIMICLVSACQSYFFKESIKGFLKYLTYFLCYLTLRYTVLSTTKKTFYFLWIILYISAILISSYGVYQYFYGIEPLATWEDPAQETVHVRIYSTLENPNLLAGYLLTLIPVFIFLPFHLKANVYIKFLSIICNIVIITALIFTGSRGAFVGFACSIIFCLSLLLNKSFSYKQLLKNKRVVLSSLPVIFLLLYFILTCMFPYITERLGTVFTLRDYASNNHRMNVWYSSLKMFAENFLFGVGPGNDTFRLAYGIYMKTGFDSLGTYNIILEILVQSGIFGGLILIAILLISFTKLLYLFTKKQNLLSLGLLTALVSIVAHGMFDTVLYRAQVFVPFFFLIASIDKLEEGESTN